MNRLELFKKLESMRKKTCGTQLSLFGGDPTNVPNQEYWRASDLEKLCGIENMPWRDDIEKLGKMVELIGRAASLSPEESYTLPYRHIIAQTSPMGTRTHDMQLSRFAAWALTSENHNMYFMRAYFMLPDADIGQLHVVANKYNRVLLNSYLHQLNSQMGGMLSHDKIPHFKFYDELNGTFFGTETNKELKDRLALAADHKDSVYNYMSAPALYALSRGLCKIIVNFDKPEARRSTSTLSFLTVKAMRDSRSDFIRRYKRSPIHDVTQENIEATKSTLSRMQKAFINEYKQRTLR